MGSSAKERAGFNPLNQVYVFNTLTPLKRVCVVITASFNPLNQVYVFNWQ